MNEGNEKKGTPFASINWALINNPNILINDWYSMTDNDDDDEDEEGDDSKYVTPEKV